MFFLTAFEEYAIQAFEEHAFDYLLKPLEQERLTKTLNRLRQGNKQNIDLLTPPEERLKCIPCTGHSRIWLMPIDEAVFATSRLSGVYVTNNQGQEGFTELTLRTLETRTQLVRCHRQYLVNMDYVNEIIFGDNGQAELILHNNSQIPVSRRYLKPLKEAIGLS